MAKTADIGPIEKAAILCYRWYTGDGLVDEDILAFSNLFGSPLSPEQLRRVIARARQSNEFQLLQSDIIERWRPRFDRPARLGEKGAQAFMQELFASFDHNLLFDYDVNASSTVIERGKVSDNRTYHPGTRSYWTLHLTTAGRALYLNDNIELEAGPGDLLLFRPEAKFYSGLHPGAGRWEHLWVLFLPKLQWSDMLEWRPLDTGIYHVALPDTKSREKIQAVFQEIVELSSEHSPAHTDLRYNRLEELLIRARGESSPPVEVIDRRIQKACDYMRRNIAEGFRLDEVATACNLSTSRLAHLFRDYMGISPKSWSNNMRLQQARKLLLANNDGISLIARRVGYDDPSQFSRYFKKSIGCSPREFRQSFGER
ncbi:MAG: arabinose operon transcriptional regulator AraC [Halioglobus sp.]|nr:arabinose operon transcriptional regulator AraC [Halioglobus sp.]